MVVAKFAVVAFLFDLFVVGCGDFGNITVVFVNTIQKGVKGRTEVKATSASITDVKNSIGLLLELRTSPIRGNEVNAFQCLNLTGWKFKVLTIFVWGQLDRGRSSNFPPL